MYFMNAWYDKGVVGDSLSVGGISIEMDVGYFSSLADSIGDPNLVHTKFQPSPRTA
jgi:hypothetical protein